MKNKLDKEQSLSEKLEKLKALAEAEAKAEEEKAQKSTKPDGKGGAGAFIKKCILPLILVILVSALPMFFMFARNAYQLTIKDVLQPMLIYIAAGTGVFLILLAIFRRPAFVGMFTAVVMFMTLNFDLMKSAGTAIAPNTDGIAVAVGITAAVAALAFFLFWKISKSKAISQLVAVFTLIFVGLFIYNMVAAIPDIQKRMNKEVFVPTNTESAEPEPTEDGSRTETPNVYYFILDELINSEDMLRAFGYDNSPFDDYLREHNFYVATKSYTATTDTVRSFVNILSLTYKVDESAYPDSISNQLGKGELLNAFDKLGYRLYQVSSKTGFYGSGVPDIGDPDSLDAVKADTEEGDTVGDLAQAGSILSIFQNKVKSEEPDEAEQSLVDSNIVTAAMKWTLRVFDYYDNPENYVFPNSTVIFSYVRCPHVPFVFQENGQYRDASQKANWSDPDNYLEQYKYVLTRLKKSLRTILENDPDCIIIIQSDHGVKNRVNYLKKTNNPYHIYSALYYRGEYASAIEGMSQVNVLRYVLSRLGADYEQIDDPAYLYFTGQESTFKPLSKYLPDPSYPYFSDGAGAPEKNLTQADKDSSYHLNAYEFETKSDSSDDADDEDFDD